MKEAISATLATLATAVLVFFVVLTWPDGGGEECYPPVTSGQPESAKEHGLVSDKCKSE